MIDNDPKNISWSSSLKEYLDYKMNKFPAFETKNEKKEAIKVTKEKCITIVSIWY